VLIMIPFWVSILVRLFAFTAILGRRGVVNSILGTFGLGPYELLFNSPAVVVGMVAYLLPYMILILHAGMSGLDPSLMTVARTMGASGRQAFFRIYLPQIRGTIVGAVMLVFVLGLGFFLTPAILGGPQDLTIPVFIQQEIGVYRWGRASAAGIVLLVLSLVGYLIAMRLGGTSILAPGGRGSRGTVAREPLPRSIPTVVAWIVTVLVLVLLLVPLLITIPAAFGTTSQIAFPPQGFTFDWFGQVFAQRSWTDSIAKSLRVGIVTAIVSTAIGLILARISSGLQSRALRSVVQAVAFAPLIIPVILLAIGTDLGLVIAHAILCVPFSFIVIGNALSHLDGSLEEAAWSMGIGRIRTFWTIVIPGIVPGLVGSAVIAFMTSWDETVVALFQAGLNKTLPVTFYSLLRSGVTPAVAAVSVLLIALVVIGGAIFLVVSGRRASSQRQEPA
jgi:putative spermidine/putrescine transport system permease protein